MLVSFWTMHCSSPVAMMANPARSRALETAESCGDDVLGVAAFLGHARDLAASWPWARLGRRDHGREFAGVSSVGAPVDGVSLITYPGGFCLPQGVYG